MARLGPKDRVGLEMFGPKKTRTARLDKNKPEKKCLDRFASTEKMPRPKKCLDRKNASTDFLNSFFSKII